ncbi:sterol C-14 reductase-like protein [Tothia fuscella]|uniref:Delta(14)-sterol reductase n=1 Tax=Tothia fuscella TaxID=1048955 RepID=A0A9P4NXD5_9PEZI|nr:sterol C-14 reductase-like protein [Tothia fuscella]
MATSKSTAPGALHFHGYEFLGPPGAFVMSFGLPLLCWTFGLLCNDVTGCPATSLLHPSTMTLESLKHDVGWHGWSTIYNHKAFLANLGYYTLSLVLYRFLPAIESEGTELRNGRRLQYRFNAFSSAMFIFSILAAGTLLNGADWVVWTFIYDNYIPLLTSNIILSYFFATFCYVRSFAVKNNDPDSRLLGPGGISGNILYDWFMGRELNPRVNLPIIGTVDIKIWMEMRPGLTGWLIMNYTFCAAQYRHFGYVTDSMLMTTIAQTVYVLDALYMEPAILTTIDILQDGFGFMLSFGDIVWVPFTYSLQTRYLAIHPVDLGPYLALPVGVLAVGYYIFRATNNEKNRFRTNPDDPKISHLKYIDTATGSKLLVSGWWGRARHINYLGDWCMSWAYCLPTGIAGYQVLRGAAAVAAGVNEGNLGPNGGFAIKNAKDWTVVVPGEARGWGIPVTYFFMVYFAVLLVHRERRDEEKCRNKYGKDWERYCEKVPSRIIPGVY